MSNYFSLTCRTVRTFFFIPFEVLRYNYYSSTINLRNLSIVAIMMFNSNGRKTIKIRYGTKIQEKTSIFHSGVVEIDLNL